MSIIQARPGPEMIWWQGALFQVKGRASNTGGAIGLTEGNFYAGFATPLHVHHHDDEAWYVLAGEFRFRRGDEEFTGTAGDFIFGPRGIPHSFKALEDGARALVLTTPGGLEEMWLEGGLPVADPAKPPPREFDVERVRALARKYGFDVVGPPVE